jgi:hypothetical protein
MKQGVKIKMNKKLLLEGITHLAVINYDMGSSRLSGDSVNADKKADEADKLHKGIKKEINNLYDTIDRLMFCEMPKIKEIKFINYVMDTLKIDVSPRGVTEIDLSLLVESKEDGEILFEMIKYILNKEEIKSYLDYREDQPNWIQLKIYREDGFDLEKIYDFTNINKYLSYNKLKECVL